MVFLLFLVVSATTSSTIRHDDDALTCTWKLTENCQFIQHTELN